MNKFNLMKRISSNALQYDKIKSYLVKKELIESSDEFLILNCLKDLKDNIKTCNIFFIMLEKHCLLLKFDVKPFIKHGSLKGLMRINEKVVVFDRINKNNIYKYENIKINKENLEKILEKHSI